VTGYRLADGVLETPLDDNQVLLNPKTGGYHVLNPTARSLLASFQEGLNLEDAARALARSSGEKEETVLEDSRSFVRSMLERGLIEER
jgi:hypothetical protein